jgi:hypothetical protein
LPVFIIFRNIFPDNLIKATFVQYQTVNTVSKHDVERNTTNGTVLDSVQVINKSHKETGGTNVLGKTDVLYNCYS